MRSWLATVLHRQPLVPAAVLFISGIALQRFCAFGPGLLLSLLLAGILLVATARHAGLGLLILSIGSTLYWARYAELSESDLRVILGHEPALVTISGRLAETPQIRDFSSNDVTTARLRVSQINLNGEWQPATGEIMTRTRGELGEDFFQDRAVEVTGAIGLPPAARAPGLFDFREYLHHNRIFYQLNADSPADWTLLRDEPAPWIERLRRWAKGQLARGLPEDEQVRLLWAMTLGWKTALSGEMAEPFMRTGTMHIVAISGLHVTCITAMLVIAIRLFGVPRHQCAVLVIPLVWLYTFLTAWQPSGVRSAIMSTALVAGWSFKRPTAMLNSTAAAALLILVFQPEQLFQAGFQLSFAVVAAIALLTEKLSAVIKREWWGDPLLPRSLWPFWKRAANTLFLIYLLPNLAVSFASFLGSLPLTAYYFNLLSPVSLLANLAAVPLSSLALMFSMLSLVLPFLHGLFNMLSWIFIYETIWVARFFEQLGGYFYVTKPGWTFLAFYFAMLAATFTGALWRQGTRLWAIPLVSLLAAVWLASRESLPTLHVLPMAGSPIWVDLKGPRNDLLIDCSNEYGFEFGVQRFLRAQGVGRLANLLLTHGDVEHAGGFALANEQFAPHQTFTSPHSSRSPAHRAALQTLRAQPDRWKQVQLGDRLLNWQVLHPADKQFPRADDNSVVLKSTIEGWRVLIVPDLSRDGQRALLESGQDLAADLLIISPPDSDSIRSELLDRINPAVAIVGTHRAFSRPNSLPDDLRNRNTPVFDVNIQDAVKIEFDRAECRVSAMRGQSFTLRSRQ